MLISVLVRSCKNPSTEPRFILTKKNRRPFERAESRTPSWRVASSNDDDASLLTGASRFVTKILFFYFSFDVETLLKFDLYRKKYFRRLSSSSSSGLGLSSAGTETETAIESPERRAEDGMADGEDAEDEIRRALYVVQSMIDISADRLEGLRTQCSTSAVLTQQEIRTLEVNLRSRGGEKKNSCTLRFFRKFPFFSNFTIVSTIGKIFVVLKIFFFFV